MRVRFFSAATNLDVLEETSENKKKYTKNTLGMVYTAPTGRREVVYMEYYSGPSDAVGIQSTKVLEEGDSKKALEDIKAFVKKHRSILVS
jgi:hypothetical protein